MSDSAARRTLLERSSGDWSIFRRLLEINRTDEDLLRRILRAHTEAGFRQDTQAADMRLRAELDTALDSLLIAELGSETGCLDQDDFELPPDFVTLSAHDSFLRYVDSYLYFGVRLLSSRFHARKAGAVSPDYNRIPFPLEPPPVPRNVERSEAEAAVLAYLNIRTPTTVEVALSFLDDFSDPGREISSYDISDPTAPHDRSLYELWLRGLWHDSGEVREESRYLVITSGIIQWSLDRVRFYKTLEGLNAGEDQAWIARNPLTARFGVADLYWLARLMGADISASGVVSYNYKSWLDQIAAHAEYIGDEQSTKHLREAAIVLRGVFDYACDLIQNSIEITEDALRKLVEPASCPPFKSPAARNWRETFDEELEEIDRHQFLRTFRGRRNGFQSDPPDGKERNWSRRIRTGEYPREVAGLAISGGGIRSATFALGILQGLQEFDILKQIDYLSTVSGGGYIGSWLVGNVHRTTHFLGRQTNWEESISHLRRYSKYLAPHTGILSADSWTMWGIWLRNAFLIQLMAVCWLLCILSFCLLGKPVFDGIAFYPIVFGWTGEWMARILVGIITLWVGVGVRANLIPDHKSILRGRSFTEWQVQWQLVIPAWIGAFLTSGLLWAQAIGRSSSSGSFATDEYSHIFLNALAPWRLVLSALLIGFVGLGFSTLKERKYAALLYGPTAMVALYAELCGIMYLFRQWAPDADDKSWYAFIAGPSLVLLSVSIAVVLFIGLCGRSTEDQIREWWTRMGSWLGIYGAAYLILAIASVMGPLWILLLLQFHWSVKWGTIGGFVGTVISGLFAGQSSKTTGTSSASLEFLARAGALLFIAGGLLGVATLLHTFLVNAFTDFTPGAWCYWCAANAVSIPNTAVVFAATLLISLLLSWRIELNIFGLNYFYRNRLVRCYLGATRWRPGMRKPNRFTGFDEDDQIPLDALRHDANRPNHERPFRGPFPIVNCTLNLGGSSDLSVQTRKSASFIMTPLRCGSSRSQVGFAPTREFSGGVELGQAVAVSGAAASPNMGYNTSSLVSFMLTMFNVRLGWWFPNPSGKSWKNRGLPTAGFFYLIRELFGYADEKSSFINVSDGGHFENLGIYELVRRRAKVIIASDGECDEQLTFGSLGNLVRICETDMGAKIDIDVSSIRKQENGLSRAHCAVGRITYSNGSEGWLIYLKASILGDEDVGVAQYRAVHPDFPHQSTADQFFSEDQFDAYRKLGRHVVQHSFRGTSPGAQITTIAQRMYDTWTPARFSASTFMTHAKTLDEIWDRFRDAPGLYPLLQELTADRAAPPHTRQPSAEELCACLELLQLMENVFVDLRLGDYWAHPDNRGWAMLFSSWAKSPTFRNAWIKSRRTFGIRFEYFCEEKLGLEKERPVARV